MDSKELNRLERLHLCTNDDGKIYGLDAFVAAIEKAAREAVLKELTEAFHESIRALLKEGS
jgi:hypothetical protein